MAGGHPACSNILAGRSRLRNSPPDGSLPLESLNWGFVGGTAGGKFKIWGQGWREGWPFGRKLHDLGPPYTFRHGMVL